VLTSAPEVEWVDDIPVPQDNGPIFLPPPPDHLPPSIDVQQVAPPTTDVAKGLIQAEQDWERNKWKPPPKRKRAQRPNVQAALKATPSSMKTNTFASSSSAACSSATAPAPDPVAQSSERSEQDDQQDVNIHSESENSSDCSPDSDTSVVPPKKK
jgi:hypothetical protein